MQSRILGKTGLRVSRIGIGSSYGIDAGALEEAFEAGINLFYFGTARTHRMARAVRSLAPRHREAIVVMVQSYTPWGWYLRRSVDQALRQLGLDYADLLILGKKDKPLTGGLLEEAVRLRDSGRVRGLVVSAHRRPAFAAHLRGGAFDAIMVRYNAAHLGAETEVFPLLPDANRPGVIAYTATRWGTLLEEYPGEERVTATDCYRFVLHNPAVDVCLAGPANREQLHAAIQAAKSPPLGEDELTRLRRIGTLAHARKHHNYLARKLIFE